MLEDGVYRNQSEPARGEGVDDDPHVMIRTTATADEHILAIDG
jgi:hypothetical protein